MSEVQLNYIVGLIPNDGLRPNYDESLQQLDGFLQDHGGTFKGWHFANGEEYVGDAIVTMTPQTAERLEEKDFVERLPVPGNHKNIWLESKTTVHPDPFFKRRRAELTC